MLTTIFEDKGFNLDALTACKDVADGHSTYVGHGHTIVKCFQFLIQFNDQVTILQTICTDDSTIFSGAAMQAEDISRAHIIFYNDPFGSGFNLGQGIFV